MGRLKWLDKNSDYQLVKHGEYELISSLPDSEATRLLDAVLEKTYSANKVYKDNENCFIVNFDIDGHSNLMLKLPKERNRRRWERFLTLFRPNEAFRNYDSMMTLQRLGLKGTVPLLAAHKKVFGMSVESFFVYHFVDGEIASKDDLSCVVDELKKLHHAGYTRSDPKLTNFLMSNNEAYFIDFRLKRPTVFTKFKCMLNFCKFLRTVSTKKEFIEPYYRNNGVLRLAYILQSGFGHWRTFRRTVKCTILRRPM